MTKKDIVKDFLSDVKDQKIKQLLGIVLDLSYWKSVIGDRDENKLREELKKENEKKVVNANGTVFKDDRDMEKIGVLSKDIEIITKAQNEITKLREMEIAIKSYLEFVNNPSKETSNKFEEIIKL